jgi:polyhydroxyalkanoate synthesis regulator phasin
MKEFWRKTWFFGLGLIDTTKEKMEDLVEEMIKRGEVTQQEKAEAIEQITARARETQRAFFDRVRELVMRVISEMHLARAADLQALEKRVAALEKELVEREIEGRQGVTIE